MTSSVGCFSNTGDVSDLGESAPPFKQSRFRDDSIASRDQPVSQAGDSDLTAAAKSFNLIIEEFRAGGSDHKVAEVTAELMSQLPTAFRANCMLVTMITNHRIGKHEIAKRLAIELDRKPTVAGSARYP